MYIFKYLKNRKPTWTTRKISYVGVLIAASVVFVLIGSMLFAITTFPSFKISFAGIPVKITGFMFGPLIGAITGFLADIISFLYLPTYYHIGYSVSLSITGFVPGLIMWIFSRKSFSTKTYFWSASIVLFSIIGTMTTIVYTLPESIFANKKLFIHSRAIYEAISVFGYSALWIMLIIFRFVMNEKNFKGMSQIIMFSAILARL